MNGSLALVGSGEYLPAMAAFEKSLLDDGVANGKAATYVQIPTAAGRESQDSLNYWKNLVTNKQNALACNQFSCRSTTAMMLSSKNMWMQ